MAVRAAGSDPRVLVIEKQNTFSGVAANTFVNIWHSPFSADYKAIPRTKQASENNLGFKYLPFQEDTL
jgi:hypothetical protein